MQLTAAAQETCGDTTLLRHFNFSAEERQAFQFERYHHPDPRVHRKMEVLWLKSQGFTHEVIAQTAGVSRRSVQRYLDEFPQGGLEELRTLTWQQPQSALAAQRTTLAQYCADHPPRSAHEAQAVIAELTGIRRGLTQVRHFLKALSACATAR